MAPAIERLTAPLVGLSRRVGERILALFAYFGELAQLCHETVQHILRGEVTRREAFDQLSMIVVGSWPIVAVTVCFSGLVFGIYAVAQFKNFGASSLIGVVAAQSMSREVAPVLAATVVAARCGSAIAAEIATMKVTEQIDALRALATDPIEYLAVPRYIALVVGLPMLALIGMTAGTWGAGMIANMNGISWREYFSQVPEKVPPEFVVNGCIKATVFGALVAIASIRQGLRCGYGSEAIGRATTAAVVYSIVLIHLANLLISAVTQ